MSREQQRLLIDKLNKYNSRHLSDRIDNTALSARISSYELAYKMQMSAPRRWTSTANRSMSKTFMD